MLQLNVFIICGTVLKDPYNDHYLNESLLIWIQKRHMLTDLEHLSNDYFLC